MHRILLTALCLWGALACQQQPATTTTAAKAIPVADTTRQPMETDSSFLNKAYLMGQFDPAQHPDFVHIDPKYADKPDLFLRKEAYAAFLKMREAAAAEGIRLLIRSATRPFHYQRSIWEGKWTGERKVDGKDLSKSIPDAKTRALKILEYSSMPGTSRHHWGTDIDLNAFENSYFESGQGLKEYNWLVENGPKFGFCQVYSQKGEDRPHGYNMEKWHWSYLPIAQQLTNFAETALKDEDITGFKGAEAAPQIGVVEKYVLGINPACR
ncbi:MAG: M15 family metallopeptidase [Phaeodactylibacter sp.]|nr:M15 family metallopeptidase [Phaeodactylibacter sp.]